jgi:CHASE2 domain-containing sensor protein
MSRLLSTLTLVAIIGAAGSFLVAAGWIPWASPVAVAALALVIAGFALRRRRRPGSAATRSEAGRAAAAA